MSDPEAQIVRVQVRAARTHTCNGYRYVPDQTYQVDLSHVETLRTLGMAYRVPPPPGQQAAGAPPSLLDGLASGPTD